MKLFFRIIALSALLVMTLSSTNFQIPQTKPAKAQTSLPVQTFGTIHSAGIRIGNTAMGIPDEVKSASLQYKKQSSATWKEGLQPIIALANRFIDGGSTIADNLDIVATDLAPMVRRLHGSIMYLDPSTAYDIKVTLKKSDGSTFQEFQTNVTTKSDQVTYGNGTTRIVGPGGYSTISAALSASVPGDIVLIKPGIYTGNFSPRSGEPGKPITIRGETGTILENTGSGNLIELIEGAHDVIIEGFEIRNVKSGTSERQIRMSGRNARIVIQNMRFSFQVTGSDLMSVILRGSGSEDILIQNNILETTVNIPYTFHLTGGVKGLIFRNNQIKVGDCYDELTIRGWHEDVDIYNNTVVGNPGDDGMELEGGVNINVRMWNNYINVNKGIKGTISNTPVIVGPVYIFRNEFYGARQAIKTANAGVQSVNSAHPLADFAPLIYMHNTFHFYGANWWGTSECSSNIGDARCAFLRPGCCSFNRANFVFKNNIFHGRILSSSEIACTVSSTCSSRDLNKGKIDSDYNVFWNGVTTSNPNSAYIDQHSIFSAPGFVSASPTIQGDIHLASSSPAINKGTILPNINDSYAGSAPDIGRFELGEGTGISLTKSVDKSTALSNDTLTYTISYTVGNQNVTSVKIEDLVDTTKVTITDQGGATLSGSTLTWNLGNLAAGATGQKIFKVQVK